jgi:hypothetical protein
MVIPLENVDRRSEWMMSWFVNRYVPTILVLQAYCHEEQGHKFTSLATPIQSPLAHFGK